MASKSIKGITIQIGGDTTRLGKALGEVNNDSKSLQSELRQVDKLLKFDDSNVTLLGQKQEILTEAVSSTSDKLKILEEAEKQVQEQFKKGEVSKEQYRALEREIESTKSALDNYNEELDKTEKAAKEAEQSTDGLGGEVKELDASLKQAGDSAEDSAGEFTVLKGTLADLAADGVQAVTEELKEMAGENEKASNKFAAATGATAESIGEYNKAMEEVYKNNFGESIEDVADKMALVKQATGELDPKKLQEMTENLYTLEDTFGMDFSETIRGAQGLMDHFGLTSQQAFDLIATGAQSGLNWTDELGDNVAEYSGKFAEAGYSAEEYFNLLKNGADGGAYNLDKVNDAINEVTTRLADGTIKENLGTFSKKTQKLFKDWEKGKVSQKEVVESIVKDIRKTKGEQDKMNKAALAFGTMAEDGGVKFIESLSSVDGKLGKTKGKMEEIKQVRYDDIVSEMESVGRTMKMEVLAPIVEDLLPVIKDVIDTIANNLPTITGIVTGFFAAFAVVKVAGILSGLIGTITTIISVVQSGVPIMTALNVVLAMNPIVLIVAAIAALVTAFITLWNTSDSFREFWIKLWDKVKNIVKTAWTAIANFFTKTVPQIIKGIIKWFAELPGKIWEKLKEVLAKVRDWGIDMAKKAGNAAKEAIAAAIDWFSKLPGKTWEKLVEVVAKIKAWGVKSTKSAKDAAKEMVAGVIDWFSKLPGKTWDKLKEVITKVNTWGRDLAKKFKDLGKNAMEGLIDGIGEMVSKLYTKIKDSLSGLVDKAKKTLGIRSPSRVFKDEVGKNIPPGIEEGVDDEMPGLEKDIKEKLAEIIKHIFDDPDFPKGSPRPVLETIINGSSIVDPQFITGRGRTEGQPGKETAGSKGYTQIVNITSNRELSPSEVARQTRNATRQMVQSLQRG